MKKYFCSAGWVKALSLILAAGCASLANSAELYRAPTIPNTINGVTFEAGNWTPHLAAGEAGVSWGNHRAVVVVESDNALRLQPSAVLTTIPWRRRDTNPDEKAVVVVDESTGKVVSNVLVLRIENTSGDIVFQPNPGSARYPVYYLPWQSTGPYYPTITYPTQTEIMHSAAAPALDSNSAFKAGGQKDSNFSWTGLAPNPDLVWAMMNDFGIAESEMLGYCVPDPKVTTDHPRILATTYIRPGSTLIALASWSDTDEVVKLNVNWAGLKMGDASGAETSFRAYTPAVA
ncbi:MAG: DUF6067 family protein, partial [Haliea sp.]|nr:DUF6067 family protein [Haliea sp.]